MFLSDRQSLINCYKFLLVSLIFTISACSHIPIESAQHKNYQFDENTLTIEVEDGLISLKAYPGETIEVHLEVDGLQQLPSYAKKENLHQLQPVITNSKNSIRFQNGKLSAVFNKSDSSISFYRDNKLLTHQSEFFYSDTKIGFSFEMDDFEKIMGGGERVLGMNRRGHSMPLYNRAHYGYSTESNQMNYSLPAIMSSKRYSILFDNTAKGKLDIGKTDTHKITFEAVSGRAAYIVFAADDYPTLINNYVDVTGKQPMPPRWVFGHFLSRFGYRSEQQVRDTVNKTIAADIPVDSAIIDIYWFGEDIKGHLGNLDWDRNTYPTAEKMIKDLKTKGVNTILVTEPFIIKDTLKWDSALENKALITHSNGEPYIFDFYFGTTGLVDVFNDKAVNWFWDIYAGLFDQGIAGSWGDLGEPEVHPDDALHYVSAINRFARADEVHNAYGHLWAKMIYENQIKIQPNSRPFIMMRSGFAGSQRYGMIPWTGDVDQSWDGLKPQVELNLQMGLFGLAYTHSDLGGFVSHEKFDKEMYIRWLQYGVFQPIFRPHAQDHYPVEPDFDYEKSDNPFAAELVYHDQETIDIIREFIKLRYQLLPYIYTLAYQNSSTGMPLMRPVFFEDESNNNLIDIKDAYLWGNEFYISPITAPKLLTKVIHPPKGVWFDFWTDKRIEGGEENVIAISIKTIPVFVKAGAFIPMVNTVQTIRDYTSKQLNLHYYADRSVSNSQGFMYEDDGKSLDSIQQHQFELLNFSSHQEGNILSVKLERSTQGYQSMPKVRRMTLTIHNWPMKPASVSFTEGEAEQSIGSYRYDSVSKQLIIEFIWSHQPVKIKIN